MEQAFNLELAKQYRIKYGSFHECVFEREKDLWRCSCGAVNRAGEEKCHHCGMSVETLSSLDVDALQADCDSRLEAEQKRIAEEAAARAKKEEEEKAVAAEKAQKAKKFAIIAVLILIFAIAVAVLLFVRAVQTARLDDYNAAIALADEGKYDEAIASFTELGNYKDCAEQITVARYNQAVSFIRDKKYDEAIAAFTELGDYKDCQVRKEECNIRKLMETSLFDAYTQLMLLPDTSGYEFKKELLAVCEPYISYCGNFKNEVAELHSDFGFYDGYVYWNPTMPEGNEIVVYNDTGVVHTFFSSAYINMYNLRVKSSMEVSEVWAKSYESVTTTAKFDSGEIIITMKSVNRISRECYWTESWSYSLVS